MPLLPSRPATKFVCQLPVRDVNPLRGHGDRAGVTQGPPGRAWTASVATKTYPARVGMPTEEWACPVGMITHDVRVAALNLLTRGREGTVAKAPRQALPAAPGAPAEVESVATRLDLFLCLPRRVPTYDGRFAADGFGRRGRLWMASDVPGDVELDKIRSPARLLRPFLVRMCLWGVRIDEVGAL